MNNELLKKYMAHVIQCEGISFVDTGRHSDVIFTDDEVRELKRIEHEIETEAADNGRTCRT